MNGTETTPESRRRAAEMRVTAEYLARAASALREAQTWAARASAFADDCDLGSQTRASCANVAQSVSDVEHAADRAWDAARRQG